MKHTITFSDGAVLSSGGPGEAIRSVRLTSSVNPWQELLPGSVCATELEAELFAPPGRVRRGDRLVLSGDGRQLGVFWVDTVTVPGTGRLKLVAYDGLAALDGDITDFLQTVAFPCALGDLAEALCGRFGLTVTGQLLSEDYLVPAFAARGLTGRQLLSWICQAGGRFARCLPDGTLAFGWYEDRGITLSPGGEHFYFAGQLQQADYAVAPTDRVRLALREDDAGVCYPETGENTCSLVGNFLLTGETLPVAQRLQALLSFSYTPCEVTTATAIEPGELFRVRTEAGECTCLAMTVEYSGGRYRVRCTGSPDRAAPTAVCESSVQALSGRMLNLRRELDGVVTQMVAFGETVTEVSRLSQNTDHITARVAVLETDTDALGKDLEALDEATASRFAQLQLRSDGLELAVGSVREALDSKADGQTVQTLTEHFRFDEEGLTISDSATGMGIGISQERVVFTGGKDPTTAITPTGMETTDLQVGNCLHLGSFAFLPRSGGNLSLRWTGE